MFLFCSVHPYGVGSAGEDCCGFTDALASGI